MVNPLFLSRSGGLPDVYGSVGACRGDALAIRRPRDRIHRFLMSSIDEEGLPTSGVPHVDLAFAIAGRDIASAGCPIDRAHWIDLLRVAVIGEEGRPRCAAVAIRDLHGLVSSRAGDKGAIRRPAQSKHLALAMSTVVEDLVACREMVAVLYRGPVA